MKTKRKRFTEVCILDICYPDYFSGYHMPVLSIPMYDKMTNKDLSNDIQNEINSIWDYLVNDQGFTEIEMKLFDKNCDELLINPNKIIYDNDTEDIDESIHTYISLCKPVFKYGMQWLNE